MGAVSYAHDQRRARRPPCARAANVQSRDRHRSCAAGSGLPAKHTGDLLTECQLGRPASVCRGTGTDAFSRPSGDDAVASRRRRESVRGVNRSGIDLEDRHQVGRRGLECAEQFSPKLVTAWFGNAHREPYFSGMEYANRLSRKPGDDELYLSQDPYGY
jgi:hypothetical protein